MTLTEKFNLGHIPRFLSLAEHISTWSKDPSTKVGAVLITLDGKVASTGYNGLPYSHDDRLVHIREYKIEHVIHAEMNAIANRYIFDKPCILFVSKPMCPDCAKLVTAHRFIQGVVWVTDNEFTQRWNSKKAIQMLEKHFKSIPVITPGYTMIINDNIKG